MATSEARTQASVKYNRKMDQITIRPSKERGAAVRAAAQAAGRPLQAWIMETLEERIAREAAARADGAEDSPSD